jgi:hypothetical protein
MVKSEDLPDYMFKVTTLEEKLKYELLLEVFNSKSLTELQKL